MRRPKAKAAEVAELIDLQWDGQPKERSLDYDAHVELPISVRCPFCRTRGKCGVRRVCFGIEGSESAVR